MQVPVFKVPVFKVPVFKVPAFKVPVFRTPRSHEIYFPGGKASNSGHEVATALIVDCSAR